MSNAPVAYFDPSGKAIFRASAVNKCTKALVASLLGYEPMSPPDSVQARFDAGHLYEQTLLDHVTSHGYVLYGGQNEYDLAVGNDLIIRGHIDSLASHREHGIALVEAKTMSPKQFDLWKKKRWLGGPLFNHYAEQVSLYWESIQPNLLVMIVGRKKMDEDGNVVGIDAFDMTCYFEQPRNTAPIKARLAKVLNQARTGRLPDDCDTWDYPCPFYLLHDDKTDAPVWMSEELLDDFALAAEKYLAAQADEKVAKKAKEAAKGDIDRLLDGHTTGASGRYRVEYVDSPRTAWDVEAMVADGVDVDKYRVVSEGKRITVKEVRE